MTIGFHEGYNNTRNVYDDIREWKTGAWGWMHGGDFLEQNEDSNNGSFGNISSDSYQRRLDAGFTPYHALIDTNPHDIPRILELYKSDRFNPYAANQYAFNDKEVREGSVADVLYGLTKDRNQTKRMDAYNALRGFEGDAAQERMTQRFWNQYGLNDVFGEYNDNVDNPFATNPLMQGDRGGDASGGFMSGFNAGRDNTGASDFTGINSGGREGFLGAYQAKREDLEANRPSVRSLFKEMEDYENE